MDKSSTPSMPWWTLRASLSLFLFVVMERSNCSLCYPYIEVPMLSPHSSSLSSVSIPFLFIINQTKLKVFSISSVPSSHSRKHNHRNLKLVFSPSFFYRTIFYFFFMILHSTHCLPPLFSWLGIR